MNVLAWVTEAVTLLNGDPDSQAAALWRLEKRQVSLSDPGLLVDLRGAWLDLFFRDRFWHCSLSKFQGRERDLVVEVAERALLEFLAKKLDLSTCHPNHNIFPFSLSSNVLTNISSVLTLLDSHQPLRTQQHTP